MPKPTRTYPITLESLTAYQQSAMRNAVALAEEAQLLYEAGHDARTYFLAEAAIEEAGKAAKAPCRDHGCATPARRPLGLAGRPAAALPVSTCCAPMFWITLLWRA